jgi:hypothetical protein
VKRPVVGGGGEGSAIGKRERGEKLRNNREDGEEDGEPARGRDLYIGSGGEGP